MSLPRGKSLTAVKFAHFPYETSIFFYGSVISNIGVELVISGGNGLRQISDKTDIGPDDGWAGDEFAPCRYGQTIARHGRHALPAFMAL